MGILIIHLKMGPVENEVEDQKYENDEISGTAETDFANDWEVSHRSTPNLIISIDGLHAAHQCVTKMQNRAIHTVFWLGLYKDLEGMRDNCSYCNKSTSTQASLPPHKLHSPDYLFQMIVMDYCNTKSKSWLICADRFTSWVSTFYFPREPVDTDLVRLMKEYFVTFGVVEHVSSDEGSQFVSTKFKQFLQSWGTDYHKVSSARNPHSNLRAETEVKLPREC